MVEANKKKLESFLRKIAEDRDYKNYEVQIKPISSGGANYSSQLFAGTVSAADKEDLKIFAKVALLAEDLRTMMPSNIYVTEQFFYSKVAAAFKKIQDKYEVPEDERLRIPKVFGYDATPPSEVMVLEDLAVEGFAIHDRFRSFDWEYAAAAVQQLARLHALSIALEKDPSVTDEYEEIKNTIAIAFNKHESLLDMMQDSLQKSTELIREENRELVRNYLAKNIKKIMDGLNAPRSQKVLVHGDFRTSNIMHKLEQDGKIKLIVLDYQTVMFGSPIIDLLYFIFTGSDAQFRRYNFHPLLDYYHDQLAVSLARLDLNVAKIFPKHEFDRELKQHFGIGLTFALMTLPIMTVEAEAAPALDDSLNLDKLMSMTPSALCVERLNEVVDDYIAWDQL